MFSVGDKVQYSAFGKTGDTGTVTRVVPLGLSIGGVKCRYRVRWDTYGAEGTETLVDDRVLVSAPK